MRRTLSTTALVALAGALVIPAPAAHAQEPVVLSVGHVDVLDIRLVDGELALTVKDDTQSPAAIRDPAEVILQALPSSELALPAHPDFAFLGEPGDPVWSLPQSQNPALLWPGWNTEQLDFGVLADDQVTVMLTGVDGPGRVFIFMEDALGLPVHQFSVEQGFPDQQDLNVSTHAHATWVFTAEGTYTLWFQAEATLLDGTQLTTGPVPYTFVVGELPEEPEGPSQVVVATVPELGGALVISVDPDDQEVVLPPAQLASTADRLESTGELRPVTVTDTRSGAPGWDASGALGDFTSVDGGLFGARFAGWTPAVVSQAGGQGVAAGPPVPTGFPSGDGLSVAALLARAPAGNGFGTAVLGAQLRLELPTETLPGAYQATLTLTAI